MALTLDTAPISIHVAFKMGLTGLGEGACWQAIFASWIARKQAPTKGRHWAHRERDVASRRRNVCRSSSAIPRSRWRVVGGSHAAMFSGHSTARQ